MKFCYCQQHGWTWRVSCLVKLDRKRQILHAFTYMQNVKNKMNEYKKAERNLQIQRTNERRE